MYAQAIQLIGIVSDKEQARLVEAFIAGRFYPADPLHYPDKMVEQMFFASGCVLVFQNCALEVLIPHHLLKGYKQPLSRDNDLG